MFSSAAAPALAGTKDDAHKKHNSSTARSGTPPWLSCAAIGQDPQKIIKNYTRDDARFPTNGGPVLNKGNSTLRCGTTGWGYFHIKKLHQSDWQSLAYLSSNQGWMDVAHQGLLKTLKDPDKVTWSSSRQTWCVSGKINFYEGSEFITSHFVQTIVGRDTNIVSSYPASKQCEDNSHD